MKRTFAITLCLAVILLVNGACTKGGVPVAGTAKATDMLSLLPQSVSGVLVIDVKRGMELSFVDKALKEPGNTSKLQEFIQKTGIDPKKDVYLAAIGIIGGLNGEPTGVGILNLKYNKATLMAKMKEMPDVKFTEGVYEGITTLTGLEVEIPAPKEEKVESTEGIESQGETPAGGETKPQEETPPAQEPTEPVKIEKPTVAAFLDASNIAFGPEAEIKAVIDILVKKAKSAKDNAELMSLVKKANSSALVWGVYAFKPEDVKKMVESTPMLSSLSSLKAMILSFDYVNKILDVDLKALTADAGKNKEIADMLTGFKAMGSMASGEKPEVGELLSKIEITSGADNVRIHAALPEELIEKLGKMAEAEIASKLGGEVKSEEPKPEKKTEEIK